MSDRTGHVTEHAGPARPNTVGPHRRIADERSPVGGGTGPGPFEPLPASSGASWPWSAAVPSNGRSARPGRRPEPRGKTR